MERDAEFELATRASNALPRLFTRLSAPLRTYIAEVTSKNTHNTVRDQIDNLISYLDADFPEETSLDAFRQQAAILRSGPSADYNIPLNFESNVVESLPDGIAQPAGPRITLEDLRNGKVRVVERAYDPEPFREILRAHKAGTLEI